MKAALVLLLIFLTNCLYAQNEAFFTTDELRRLVTCPTPDCFRNIVRGKGYEYHNNEISQDGNLTSHTYRILDRSTNPAYPYHIIIYAVHSSGWRTIGFTTKSPRFPAWLDHELDMSGYILDGTGKDDEEQRYRRDEGAVVWQLTRSAPTYSLSGGGNKYTILFSGRRRSSDQSTNTSASRPGQPTPTRQATQAAVMPHLGGAWDTQYPVQQVANVLRAERQYAADQERERGKMGNTFSRVEKMRIAATYTGQYRTLTSMRWDDSFSIPLQYANYGAFAAGYPQLFQQEALFDVGGERIWMPIQQPVSTFLRKESPKAPITLYALLVSYHDFGGVLHLSFLINEFATDKE